MQKNILLISFLFLSVICFSQKSDRSKLNSCQGAVNLFGNGDYQLQFSGEKSQKLPSNYPSLSELNSDNLLWVSFIAPNNGELTFLAHVEKEFLQLVIFGKQGDLCSGVEDGSAEIKRIQLDKTRKKIGLNYDVGNGFQYALKLQKGQKIYALFTTEEKSKEVMSLNWTFNSSEKVEMAEKVIDMRDDDFATSVKIAIKDKETNQPILASVSLTGSDRVTGVYGASEIYFNNSRTFILTIESDADGYFFKDQEVKVSSLKNSEIIIWMEKVASGKSISIEDIEFVPGSSKISPNSEPKLYRLFDFLALNAELYLEIQGHVCAIGENTFAGQKISEARAKRIMKFLVDNGIDKKRLSAVGYGNTQPIYPKPIFSYEEQANRRVEILVK